MGNDNLSNEEQLEMLLMTLEEVHHGICLFQSENQAKWASLIQKRLGEKNIIVHNIADDDMEKGMVNAQDFRRWASETDAEVVLVYNLQLLGMRFGDEEVIAKLNFMRDQLLAISKIFVFGVSPYFSLLLSRGARDLYSCILHHFTFHDSEEDIIRIRDIDMKGLSGDDVLRTARYRELKERIQNNKGERDISMCLACMKSWGGIREYLSCRENDYISILAEEVEQWYAQKDIKVEDVENIWLLAGTWIGLEKIEKSHVLYQKALYLVGDTVGEEHELYADALVEYTKYYMLMNDFIKCETLCDRAMEIYRKRGTRYSERIELVLHQEAVVYKRQSRFNDALDIYESLLEYQINEYGERYYGNAVLYSNIGKLYEEQGDLSGALSQYKKALELFNNAGKQGTGIVLIYRNLCMLYLRSGDGSEAWRYIKKAKRIVEDIYGENSNYLIYIYSCMAEVWKLRKRPDKELEYLRKALNVINRLHMENSGIASYIYFDLGVVLFLGEHKHQAAAYLKHAIEIREQVYGEKDEKTANSYEALAYILYDVASNTEAKKNIDRARRIYVSLYGDRNEKVKRIDEFLKIVKQ